MSSGYTPYFIGPVKTGLELDLDSYLIPEDAFPTLLNAYAWRGRIYKKGGNEPLDRLGRRVDNLTARTGGADIYNTTTVFHPIEPGSLIITDGTTTFTDDGVGGFVITGSAGNTVNVPTNYTTGAFNITFANGNMGAAVTASYIVAVSASSPVMGLRTFDLQTTNQEDIIAFDLVAAYLFNKTTGIFQHLKFYKQATAPAQTTQNAVAWTGSNTDFFYSCNYQLAMFATNNVTGSNFYLIDNVISGATTQIHTTVANNFAMGDVVYLNNIGGVTGGVVPSLNNVLALVTIAGNPFTVAVNTGGAGAYTAGTGIAWSPTLSKANAGDGIRWTDSTYTWVNFEPPLEKVDATNTIVGRPRILQGCLIILPYKGRLCCLNTLEGVAGQTPTRFGQRLRYSQVGNVFYTPPFPAGNTSVNTGQEWDDVVPEHGGFIDAPTGETIVGAEFIKDTLVVYFQYSIWRVVFTGNPNTPFLWEKINTEIGSNSTFSVVPFDRQILSIGPYGAYACDSINVERIDRIIPDEIFSFQVQANANKRVHGIRDFYGEFVYWTYPVIPDSSAYTQVFPNRCLIYNYVNPSFSIFTNSFTCFGQYNIVNNLTWASATISWDDADFPWNTFDEQPGFPIIIAGNQQGFVFQLQSSDGSPIIGNSPSLVVQSITNANPSVWTSINHNLQQGDFLEVIDTPGSTGLDDTTIRVGPNPTANTFTAIDSNGVPIVVAAYTFGAQLIVQDNFEITSKNLNPFFSQGQSMRLGWIDFYLENVEDGNVTIELFNNDNATNTLEPKTVDLTDTTFNDTTKFWRRVHFNTQGSFIQFDLNYSALQMFDADTINKTFIIHGMTLWMKPTGRITQ